MITFNKKLFWFQVVLVCALFFLMAWSLPALSNPLKGKGEGEQKQTIVIKSKTLEVDNKRRIVTFTGEVDARKDDMTITCQKMVVYYVGQPEAKGKGKEGLRIDRIIATGNVKIIRPDGSSATAEQATYYQAQEKVVLTGKPVVKQGNDFVEGSSITLLLRENRSIVKGSKGKKAKAVLTPRSMKR
ncbi:MAG: lipopolysaccharide transport periplasmic protein LptA [Deltaproteobacteria bacterium]|nr:lipopolysaccharide transport periplasmic protein LptA [Deltaproteobacteria bacterium]